MPSPLTSLKELLEQLSGGPSASADVAQQIDTLVGILKRYTLDELLKAADFLDTTSKSKDRVIALDTAKTEVAKLPTKDATPVDVPVEEKPLLGAKAKLKP